MTVVRDLAPKIGLAGACKVMSLNRAEFYRARRPWVREPRKPGPKNSRRYGDEQRSAMREVLNSERFVDKAPEQVVAILLDDDCRWLASPRTLYRVLAEAPSAKIT